jgi:hypothetical protein
MSAALEPIILGHNAFIGIDHLSLEREREKRHRFGHADRIAEILRCCDGLGVRGLLMSTHERAAAICGLMARDHRLGQWRLYPLIPYLQKFIDGANEQGVLPMLLESVRNLPFGHKIDLLMRGGRGFLQSDIRQGLCALIDLELAVFRQMNLGVVFLHNALTDLALGLDLDDAFEIFRDHVAARYGAPVGFITMNVPVLRRRLEQRGWPSPIIMSSINATGFWVNPSLDAVAEELRRPGMVFAAMNTLAAGALNPERAYQYLGQFATIASVVIGVSRPDHAVETIAAVRKHVLCAGKVVQR